MPVSPRHTSPLRTWRKTLWAWSWSRDTVGPGKRWWSWLTVGLFVLMAVFYTCFMYLLRSASSGQITVAMASIAAVLTGIVVAMVVTALNHILVYPWLVAGNRKGIRAAQRRRQALCSLIVNSWVVFGMALVYSIPAALLKERDGQIHLHLPLSGRDWLPAGVGAVLSSLTFFWCRWFTGRLRQRFVHSLRHRHDCDRCGYPLQASGSPVCPECGAPAPRPPWRKRPENEAVTRQA
ncbi:MAG: hypothetical protein IT442_00815 [Phycisphaeraceae bacterium]|nr:hypothetical protein [Phycisphaeraceae bacterium]